MAAPKHSRNPVVVRLVDLANELMQTSARFLEQPNNLQLWYNRGYANGILSALEQADIKIEGLEKPDPEHLWAEHRFTTWGQAFIHGQTKGHNEARDILERLCE